MYCGVPSEDPEQLVALILAGGQSTRMGTDKGMLTTNGQTWIQHAGKLCTSIGLSVYYSVNATQQETYASIISKNDLIVDALDVKGPLAGLLSFYVQHPQQDVLLLPCDMIELNTDVLNVLTDVYKEVSVGHDVMVFQHNDGNIEPMPGVYTTEALKKLYWLFASGALKKHSLKHCIDISNSYFIQIDPSIKSAFTNANTPQDLSRS